jgi:hypothetical protein
MPDSGPVTFAFIPEEDRPPLRAREILGDVLTMDAAVQQLLGRRSANAGEGHPEPEKFEDKKDSDKYHEKPDGVLEQPPPKLMIEKNVDGDDDDDDDEACWREPSSSLNARGRVPVVM